MLQHSVGPSEGLSYYRKTDFQLLSAHDIHTLVMDLSHQINANIQKLSKKFIHSLHVSESMLNTTLIYKLKHGKTVYTSDIEVSYQDSVQNLKSIKTGTTSLRLRTVTVSNGSSGINILSPTQEMHILNISNNIDQCEGYCDVQDFILHPFVGVPL